MNFALMLATLVALAAVVYGHPRRYMGRGGRARGAVVRGAVGVGQQVAYNTGLSIGKVVSGGLPIIHAGAQGVRNGIRGSRRGGYRSRGGRYGGRRSGSISGHISIGGRASGSSYY